MHSSTSFLTVYLVVASVATVITLLWGLRAAISRAALTAREQSRGLWVGTALLVGWFFAALLSSWLGLYQGALARIPTIEFGLLLPIIAGVVFYWTSPLLRRITAAAPQSLIVGVQLYRVLGVIFLLLLLDGSMPGVFAAPAGTGDVAVGLLAPGVAWAFTRGLRGSTGLVRVWNLLGLADLGGCHDWIFELPVADQVVRIRQPEYSDPGVALGHDSGFLRAARRIASLNIAGQAEPDRGRITWCELVPSRTEGIGGLGVNADLDNFEESSPCRSIRRPSLLCVNLFHQDRRSSRQSAFQEPLGRDKLWLFQALRRSRQTEA